MAGAIVMLFTLTSPFNTRAELVFAATNSTQGLSASAGFSLLGGGELQITLTNTYIGDTPDQSHVLTGLFFSGADGLTPISATAQAGSLQWQGTSSSAPASSLVLGTEWGYGSGSSGPGGSTAGIVSAGYYSAVGTGNFAAPGDMLDGSAYGLLSLGYAGSDLDGLANRVYIQDAMVFVLGGFSGNLSSISHVSFQYGTMLSEPVLANVSVAPEPGITAVFAACGLAAVLVRRLRKVTRWD